MGIDEANWSNKRCTTYDHVKMFRSIYGSYVGAIPGVIF